MNKFKAWIIDVFNVCKREFHLASRDMGVMLFFLALPIVYPILYTLIYNREYVIAALRPHASMPADLMHHSMPTS